MSDGDMLHLLGYATSFRFGKYDVIKTEGGWLVRGTYGPTWFWHPVNKEWDISNGITGWEEFRDSHTFKDLAAAVETARNAPDIHTR